MSQLYHPRGLDLDESDNLYIADYYNNRVLKYNKGASTASSNANNMHHPTDVLVDGSDLIVADTSHRAVTKFALSDFSSSSISHRGTIIAGFQSSGARTHQLSEPRGLGVHGGNLYVLDRTNHRVVR